MLLKHFFTPKIAHSSYLLAGKDTCAIIDPRRDVDIYIEAALEEGLRITHIIETHLHADYISGNLELAERTGATIYAPAAAQCEFEHVPLAEGDTVEIEHVRLDVLETPGHSPEHTSYVVVDTSRSQDPVGVFCGDTLFVGDVGRPDIFPERAQELADALYHSLHDKLLRLPDHVEVYPAHGAGSLCGRSMGAKYTTTIGYERRNSEPLQITDKDEFMASVTTDMPAAPDHFHRCGEVNRVGPTLLSDLPSLELLTPTAFQDRISDGDPVILDVRSYDAFAAQHVPNAWSIDMASNLPTFAGWVLPPDKDILLVAESEDQAEEARTWLWRVGLDRVVGHLHGGMSAWASEGLETAHGRLISVHDLHERVTGEDSLVLVDVRTEEEYAERHIEGAVHIPAPDLRTRYQELEPTHPTYLVCGVGLRAAMAASILQQKGFAQVTNVSGGMEGYGAAGYSERCSVCVNPHGPKTRAL
jgi:hydroxyacylglutathione hydrolase